MKVIIDQTTYTAVSGVDFVPEADVTGSTLPINQFACDIYTTDEIDRDQWAELRDDRNTLFARYWITYAEHSTVNLVRLVAQSPLILLQSSDLPAVVYDDEDAGDVLEGIMLSLGSSLGSGDYAVDSDLAEVKVSGYCPAQSARERLQWVCYAIGGYVKQAFDAKLRILPMVDEHTSPARVPLGMTYWRPTVNYLDYVTRVELTWYKFTQGSPSTTDKWVKDDSGTTYIVTETTAALNLPDVPAGARQNTLRVEGVYLINEDNFTDVLARVAGQHAVRVEVDADIINNGAIAPGQRVSVYTAEDELRTGYVASAAFQFGLQAKSTLHLIGAAILPTAPLTITYKYENRKLDRKTYYLPVGFEFEIPNPYIDKTIRRHRYILRPLNEACTGTMVAGGMSVTEQYAVALEQYQNTLHVVSVDAISTVTETEDGETITIGVIT